MSEQAGFIAREYSPDASYYMPADELEEEHDGWIDYCYEASKVDRQHILDAVLSSLDTDSSPLYEFIDDAIANPHEPGRPKESITKLAQLGQSLLNLIAASVDDQVGLRMAIGGAR